AVLLAAGCGEAGPVGSAVRDSAGVTVVENTVPVWNEETSWRLSEAPIVTIGVVEGDAAYELFRSRGAVRLSDGRIVIATGGTHELRFYTPSGEHLRNVGGEGSGPGEFQALTMMSRFIGDSLMTYDLLLQRISVFDSEGMHIRDVNIATEGRLFLPTIVGRFSDGSYLGQLTKPLMGPNTPELTPGMIRDTAFALRVGATGATFDTIGTFPSTMMQVERISLAGNTVALPFSIHFSPEAILAIDGDRMIVGPSDVYEVRIFGADGSLHRIVPKDHVPLPVTQADIDAAVAHEIETAPGQNLPDEMLDLLDKMRAPTSMPAYRSFLTDAEGNLWVEEYRRVGDEIPRWSVFDLEGRWLGLVTGPERFRVMDIGADYVLGIATDDMDVEQARMYRLVKP
ncbi:hypothetical protein KAJ02_04670, partial [Candidatus Bipolaricaulota bacterium]|nr:hypothetical protein [Candidatus Bipolaricaulota bacterium]